MFDELFPRCAAHFDMTPPPAEAWRHGRGEVPTDALRAWSIWVLGEELLRFTASFRGRDVDFFTRVKTVYRLGRIREEMATKKGKSQPRQRKERAEWVGFLDYRLTDDELQELDEWKPTVEDIWAAVDDMLRANYRLTLSYNPQTELANCTLIDDDSDRKTGGYAVSSADSDGALALKMTVFKYGKVDGDFSSLLGGDKPKGRRG